ncbi:MAG: hypothetical protein ACFFD4_21850 [Candidatus Odinarchaeota archaeon]
MSSINQIRETIKRLAENKVAKIEAHLLTAEQVFEFLQYAVDNQEVSSWKEVLHVLRYGDEILALESESVLKEFLASGKLNKSAREEIERELDEFGQKVARAISDSDLLDIDPDWD